MEFNEDIANCADLVRRGDPDRFLAIMSAPVTKRGHYLLFMHLI